MFQLVPSQCSPFPLLSSLPPHCECWPTMEPSTECSMINPAKHFVSCCCILTNILTDIHRHRQTSRQTDELPNKAKNWRWLCVCVICVNHFQLLRKDRHCVAHTQHTVHHFTLHIVSGDAVCTHCCCWWCWAAFGALVFLPPFLFLSLCLALEH